MRTPVRLSGIKTLPFLGPSRFVPFTEIVCVTVLVQDEWDRLFAKVAKTQAEEATS